MTKRKAPIQLALDLRHGTDAEDCDDRGCLNCNHEMPIGALRCDNCGCDGNTLPEELWRDVWSQAVH